MTTINSSVADHAFRPGDPRYIAWCVRHLLRAIGEDPEREGLTDTPDRVARFWMEFLHGEGNATLSTRFSAPSFDEMVVLRGIRFYSLCEHHLLPFIGTAAVAYIPNGGGVLGLSKLARIVRKHAARLQIQERMASEIATDIGDLASTPHVGVSLQGEHLCASMRGVRSQDSQFVTNVMRGALRDKPEARAEFLDAIRGT